MAKRYPIQELEKKSTKRLLAILQKCRQKGGVWDMEWELNNTYKMDLPTQIYTEDVKAILAKREHLECKPKPKRGRL